MQMDGEPWQDVFMAHYPGLVRRLAYLVGDGAAAEDLAQEAFVRLIRRPPPRDGDLGGWLRVTGTRLAYNYLRGERRRQARERSVAGDRALVGRSGAGLAPAEDRRAAALCAALQRLGPRDRMAVLMRGGGSTYAEIAAALGMPVTSVGTTLARATRRLRSQMEGGNQRGAPH